MTYDSTQDTTEHIERVQDLMFNVASRLMQRADVHDASKLLPPEKESFDRLTPRLAELEYGTPAYMEAAKELGPALEHHYRVNSHHPEHFPNGVAGMSVLDIVEMIVDWKAASERMGVQRPFSEGLVYNQGRFGYSDEVAQIIWNTAVELGFVDPVNSAVLCNGKCRKGAPDHECPVHGKGGRA